MAVAATNAYSGPYVGNGSTTSFPFTFKAMTADEVRVTVDGEDAAEGSYSVSVAMNGGTVTFDEAPASGAEILILSDPDFSQDASFTNGGAFLPEVHDAIADRGTVRDIFLKGEVDRALKVPAGETAPTYAEFAETFRGNPGGNAMAVGSFEILSSLTIPAGTDLIRTNEYGIGTGIGSAFYIADDSVDETYAADHPALTAVSANGRGWRFAEAAISITQAGIIPGEGHAEANSDAVDELLAYLLDNIPTPDQLGTAAIKVTAPAGHFRFARPWELKQALWIEGQSNSQRHAYATHFDFDEGGFVCNRYNTLEGGEEDPPSTGADGFRIENLYCTSRAAIGTGHHGLHAVCRGDIIRCTFNLFPGDGIRVETPSGFGVTDLNANSTRILYCQAAGNGGSGIHLIGGDANCIVTIGCDLSNNGEFGLFDNSFLSNSHTGHHADGNGLGLVYEGHKITAVSSACYYPVTAWASGATIAISASGTFRSNASKLYRLLIQGGGTTANAPTHTTEAGVLEADGYKWAYEGTGLNRRYHVALGQAVAASTTTPGTNDAVWVPYEAAGAATGIPLWVTAMTWKEGGSYCSASLAGESVWAACYSEGSQPPAQIRTPAVWIGGQTAPSPWSTAAQVRGEQGSIYNPGGFLASKPHHDGNALRALFGSGLSTGIVMLIGHESLHPNSFQMVGGRDTYMLLDGQSFNYITFTGPLTTFTGGKSTAQPGVVNIPRFYLGAGSSARQIDYGSAAPASGHHAAGEVVYNIAPTAGGKVGWVCTTAGTPGTWKPFGAIDV